MAFVDAGLVVAELNNRHLRLVSGGMVTTIAGNRNRQRTDGPAMEVDIGPVGGLAVETDGTILIADGLRGEIRRLTGTNVATVATLAPQPWSDRPARLPICLGHGAEVYFARGCTIGVLAAGKSETLAGAQCGYADGAGSNAMMSQITALSITMGAELLLADPMNAVIRQLAGNVVATVAGVPNRTGHSDGSAQNATFGFPVGISFHDPNRVYLIDEWNSVVRMLNAGQVTTVAGTALVTGDNDGPASTATFRVPSVIATNGNGVIAVASTTQVRLFVLRKD